MEGFLLGCSNDSGNFEFYLDYLSLYLNIIPGYDFYLSEKTHIVSKEILSQRIKKIIWIIFQFGFKIKINEGIELIKLVLEILSIENSSEVKKLYLIEISQEKKFNSKTYCFLCRLIKFFPLLFNLSSRAQLLSYSFANLLKLLWFILVGQTSNNCLVHSNENKDQTYSSYSRRVLFFQGISEIHYLETFMASQRGLKQYTFLYLGHTQFVFQFNYLPYIFIENQQKNFLQRFQFQKLCFKFQILEQNSSTIPIIQSQNSNRKAISIVNVFNNNFILLIKFKSIFSKYFFFITFSI